MRQYAVAGAFFALTGLSAAQAGTVTETFSADIPPTPTPFTQFVLLPSFDTSLGSLDAVGVVLSDSTNVEISIFNSLDTPRTYTGAFSSLPVTVSGPLGIGAIVMATTGPFSGSIVPGFNLFPGTTVTRETTTGIAPADFGFFETPGGVLLAFDGATGIGTFSGSSDPGIFFGGAATAGVTVTVTYTYSTGGVPIPEPGSMALVSIGAGVVMLSRRRTV